MASRSMEDRSSDLMAIAQGIKDDIMSSLHVAMPGIIVSFDADTQTAVVQTAIRRRVRHQKGVQHEADPLLLDVPVCFLGGGEHALTFPVTKGDECLVFFADHCIDAWFQSGGVQNQLMPRMHSISDGFALVGFRSKPRALRGFREDKPNFVGGLLIDGKNLSESFTSEGALRLKQDYGLVFEEDGTWTGGFFQSSSDYEYYVQLMGAQKILHTGNYQDIIEFPDFDTSGLVPVTRTINGKALSENITITAGDVGAALEEHVHSSFNRASSPMSGPAVFSDLEVENGIVKGVSVRNLTPSNLGAAAVSHTHTKEQITDFPASMPASDVYAWAKAQTKPGYVWNEIGFKPNTFPPSAHSHNWGSISGKPALFTPEPHNQSWSSIVNTPATYPPEPHTHPYLPLSYCPHGVGDTLITKNPESPSVRWPGTTWEAVTPGTFIVAAGDANSDYPVDSTGGSETHVLSVDELPAHNHPIAAKASASALGAWGAVAHPSNSGTTTSMNTGTAGSGQAHENRPPYRAMYVWIRLT